MICKLFHFITNTLDESLTVLAQFLLSPDIPLPDPDPEPYIHKVCVCVWGGGGGGGGGEGRIKCWMGREGYKETQIITNA